MKDADGYIYNTPEIPQAMKELLAAGKGHAEEPGAHIAGPAGHALHADRPVSPSGMDAHGRHHAHGAHPHHLHHKAHPQSAHPMLHPHHQDPAQPAHPLPPASPEQLAEIHRLLADSAAFFNNGYASEHAAPANQRGGPPRSIG